MQVLLIVQQHRLGQVFDLLVIMLTEENFVRQFGTSRGT